MNRLTSERQRKKKAGVSYGIGGSSLLVIFAILCITVFAVLSISSVSADTSLSRRSSEAVAEYYEADLEAERILSEIRAGSIPEGVVADGNVYSYSCVINKTNELRVEVEVNGEAFTVKKWQMVYTGEWDNNEDINVWEGSE